MGRLLKLILASVSPQRRNLLKRLRIPFRVIPSRVSERCSETDPRRLARELAVRKALAVSRRNPDCAVLGADTLVVCAGRILGKPRGTAHAMDILGHLNGRWQKVYTGVALAWDGGRGLKAAVAVTRVKARRLGLEKLREFAGKHQDKAGAYAVQDRRDPFISRIVGDKDNVIGLPLRVVRRLLRPEWRKRSRRRGA